MREPKIARTLRTQTGSDGMPWQEAWQRFAAANTYWLSTVRPDGTPHAVPVLAVEHAGDLYFCAAPFTQKARNLAHRRRCVLTTSAEGVDLVLEGSVVGVWDRSVLKGVATAYADKYGWQVEIKNGAFFAEGAPTAGPPPYDVYRLEPRKGFAFPTDGAHTPVRWQF